MCSGGRVKRVAGTHSALPAHAPCTIKGLRPQSLRAAFDRPAYIRYIADKPCIKSQKVTPCLRATQKSPLPCFVSVIELGDPEFCEAQLIVGSVRKEKLFW